MSFSTLEKKVTGIVSLILSLRLLGLFMLLPIFSIYAIDYENSNAFLAGIAIGVYSLSQAIMQIPLAYLSDKIGRRVVVLIGLGFFTIGSLICYVANDINLLIFGRVIQGCGAISSVGVATLAENTNENNRASAFTIVGLSVGVAFVIGFLIGPFLSYLFNFKILFLLLFFFGILAILCASFLYPEGKITTKDVEKRDPFRMNSDMIKIYSASFMLSIILSIFLFIYPLMWKDLGKSTNELSIVYLIVFLPAAIFIYPSIRYLEKIKRIDISTSFGWIFLFISFLSFLFVERNIFSLYLLAIFFFLGSTIFHSTLPSLLSLKVSEKMRATGNGPYYIMSFLGHAIGSIIAGFFYSKAEYFGFSNYASLIFLCLMIVTVWTIVGLPKHNSIKE
ncbi:MAG: MFS transporter [Thermodesulfobacteriota bacterium]|nr:MFS transporter [Thermodesulfobacteriota bacterium]